MRLPWVKTATSVVVASQAARVKEGRAASELEALNELQVMNAAGDLRGKSERHVAGLLGWSNHRLRRTLERWAALPEVQDDPSLCPVLDGSTPRPDPVPTPSQVRPDHVPAQETVNADNQVGASQVRPDPVPGPSYASPTPSQKAPQTDATITPVQPPESSAPRAGACASFLEKKIETETEILIVDQPSKSRPLSAPPTVIDAEIEPTTELLFATPIQAEPQVLLVETLGAEEQVLQVLNEVRREVSSSARKLSMTTTMEQQIRGALKLLRKDRGLALHAALPLLRSGFVWVLTSPNPRADGARATGTPWVTLLRPSHLLDYLDLAARPEPRQSPTNRTRRSPVPIEQTTEDYVDALFARHDQVDRPQTAEREPLADPARHRRVGFGLP